MYRIRYYVDFDWVGEGAGGVGQGVLMANNPAAGAVGQAQTSRLQGAQWVVGGGYGTAPTSGNFLTALTGMAVDISTQLNSTTGPLAAIQLWESGGP